ncbi:MAG: cell division protein FtsA [Firmicutes bacterium]|nr:cell division protein FtsA [Bacillota bacterium]
MSKNQFLCSLDIGTTNTRAIVGEFDRDGQINVVGIGQSRSSGLKRGTIIDIDATVKGISEAVEQAERMIGEEIDQVYVGIGGPQTSLLRNRGVVAVQNEDREITDQDIERVMQAAQVLAIPPEREIINIRPITYVVDGYDGIIDPKGMIGVRLEMEALIVTGKATYVQNIKRCVERADLEVGGIVLKGLSSGMLAMNPDERELGCALIDIGGGVTEISIFENDVLRHFVSIPQGGDLVTYDLAHGLKVPYAQAEQIKIVYGAASPEHAGDGSISIESVGASRPVDVPAAELVYYIQPRVEEIFDYIRTELIRAGFQQPPTGGVVLTGGACQLPGLLEIAESKLTTNVRLYRPGQVGVADPSFTASTSLLHYVAGVSPVVPQKKPARKGNSRPVFNKIKSLFSELFG